MRLRHALVLRGRLNVSRQQPESESRWQHERITLVCSMPSMCWQLVTH
jgi:hypothetical protein